MDWQSRFEVLYGSLPLVFCIFLCSCNNSSHIKNKKGTWRELNQNEKLIFKVTSDHKLRSEDCSLQWGIQINCLTVIKARRRIQLCKMLWSNPWFCRDILISWRNVLGRNWDTKTNTWKVGFSSAINGDVLSTVI